MTLFIDWLNDHPWLFALFIIAARVVDVSMGTIRTICVVRGYRNTAAVLGFWEVVVWIVAVSGVLVEITVLKVIAYATGFALGNAVGIMIERRLAMGKQVVFILSRNYSHAMAFALRLANYMVTEIDAAGQYGKVTLCFVVVSRAKVPRVTSIATTVDSDAIIFTEDVRDSTFRDVYNPDNPTGWMGMLKRK